MDIRPLQQADIEAFIDDLWIPFQTEMAALEGHSLAADARRRAITRRQERLENEQCRTYIAIQDAERVGFISAEIRTPPPIFETARECHINEVFVTEAVRGQGIGRNLLSHVEGWADRSGCDCLDLNVHEANAAAISLYEGVGFSIGRYTMQKPLDQ